jgi:hypothetical protein
MKCERCGFEPPVQTCYACGESAPKWAGFCPHCGEPLQSEGSSPADPFAMENRRLCPDGNCIGIIGPEGRCVICGRAGAGLLG